MPGGNGTGPLGAGPMSGRGAGFCAGYSVPGYANFGSGRGYGMGFGRGRGGGRRWRNVFNATGLFGWQRGRMNAAYGPAGRIDSEAEKMMLQEQADALQAELDAVKQRLEDIAQKPRE